MRNARMLLRAAGSLGGLGLVLVLGVAVIAVSAISFVSVLGAVGDVYDSMMRLDHLKDVIEFNALEQVLWAGYYIDTGDEDILQEAFYASDQLAEGLAYYESDEDFSFPYEQADTLDLMKVVQADQAALLATLPDVLQSGDEDALLTAQEDADANTADLTVALTSLVFDAEAALRAASAQARESVQTAVTLGAASLVVLPILAGIAFGIASRMARPVLALTTAVTALGGGQFRTSLTAEVARRHDRFGKLARAIEALAADAAAHETALEHEVEALRRERNESRRRKIVFSSRKPGA